MIGRLHAFVLDCPNPWALADFYSAVLGLPVTYSDDDWVVVGDRDSAHVAFQLAPDHVPPQWPDPAHPQQMHLDIRVDDVDVAEEHVLALGRSGWPAEAATSGSTPTPPGTRSASCGRPRTTPRDVAPFGARRMPTPTRSPTCGSRRTPRRSPP